MPPRRGNHGWLAELLDQLPHGNASLRPDPRIVDAYLTALAQAHARRRVTSTEAMELAAFLPRGGFTQQTLAATHQRYLATARASVGTPASRKVLDRAEKDLASALTPLQGKLAIADPTVGLAAAPWRSKPLPRDRAARLWDQRRAAWSR